MMLPVLFVSAVLLGPTPEAQSVPSDATVTESGSAAEPFIAKGLDLYKRLRLRAAREEFQKAVDADPENAAAHYYLGYTLYKIGEPTRRLSPEKVQATEQFARCYDLDPTFRPIWRSR